MQGAGLLPRLVLLAHLLDAEQQVLVVEGVERAVLRLLLQVVLHGVKVLLGKEYGVAVGGSVER